MLKLVVSAFLMLLFVVLATAARWLMPHEAVGVKTATPQQVYFRLHHDDELTAEP